MMKREPGYEGGAAAQHRRTVVRWAPASMLSLLMLLSVAAPRPVGAAQDIAPASDAEVIERLAPRVRVQTATPAEAAATARRWITESRQTAEPRYLGRAQAALGNWWGRADAPPELAVLQATIEQSRHEFAAARATLERSLKRERSNAQGWLTLATIERVAGNYDAALAACREVGNSGAALYAEACRLETGSLLGHHDAARAGLGVLLKSADDAGVRAWLLSLIGEVDERAGREDSARVAYQASLAIDADDFTALALADLLLRQSKHAEALQALANRPPSDAVQLRRAWAMKRQGQAGWRDLAADLTRRFDALAERGDDPALHGREAALFALWIEPDAARAFEAAQANLRLQKEPLDWWLALSSAEAAGRAADVETLARALRESGLSDARLARWTR